MRNRRHVANSRNFQASSLQSPNRSFAAGTRPFDRYLNLLHTMFHSRTRSCLSSHLRSIRRALSGSLKADVTCGRPGNHCTGWIRDAYNRVVKRRTDVSHTRLNILSITTTRTRCSSRPTTLLDFCQVLHLPRFTSSYLQRSDEDLYVCERWSSCVVRERANRDDDVLLDNSRFPSDA